MPDVGDTVRLMMRPPHLALSPYFYPGVVGTLLTEPTLCGVAWCQFGQERVWLRGTHYEAVVPGDTGPDCLTIQSAA